MTFIQAQIEAAARAIGCTKTPLSGDDEACNASCKTDGGTCICIELHYDQAKAALIAAERESFEKTSGWQPIETAPSDGTDVLVYRPDERDGGFDAHVGVDYYKNGTWWHSRRDQQPTHWRPLPPRPEE